MPLRHIVAAVSESEEGRAAVQVAACLGQRVRARVTALSVAPEPLRDDHRLTYLTSAVRDLVTSQLAAIPRPHPAIAIAVQSGLPGVEVGRFAEENEADLIVMGRKPPAARSHVDDTLDGVARRSRIPCLFVPPHQGCPENLLVALDGTDRGLSVLDGAIEFARATRTRVRAVTVEPVAGGESLSQPPTAAAIRIHDAIGRVLQQGDADAAPQAPPLKVRRGEIVEELLSEAASDQTDVLVFGCHRGGPSASGNALNVARRLLQLSATALLIIPL